MDCIQRKIVVRPCPTTIPSCFEGFSDDHFAVTLKPLCGEGGIRTRETLLAFTHFPGVPLQPLEHLSLVGAPGSSPCWKAPQRYNNIRTLPNRHLLLPFDRTFATHFGREAYYIGGGSRDYSVRRGQGALGYQPKRLRAIHQPMTLMTRKDSVSGCLRMRRSRGVRSGKSTT